MIRVTVDLVPFGDEEKSKKIAEMIIANDGSGDHHTASYGFVLGTTDGGFVGEGAVDDFPRSSGIWNLIRRCLASNEIHNDKEFIDLLEERLMR